MKFSIVTIFPNIFKSFSEEALISRAIKKRIISLDLFNLRDWTKDAHKTVDGRPYGGGVGMVMRADIIAKAIKSLKLKVKSHRSRTSSLRGKKKEKVRVIVFSAKGKKFTQTDAKRLAKFDQLIMICGRYEGIDERVIQYLTDEEISIGDYVLFGGEVPAMVVVEAVSRMIPGTVGKQKSVEDESFSNLKGIDRQEAEGVLEYPHYTRPEAIKIAGKNRLVPKVLLAGDHKKVDDWRKKQSFLLTKKRRPDLLHKKN
jgi:tRNA (guanine37-N1)-methyltransferase